MLEKQENLILIDWLTFVCKKLTLGQVCNLLGDRDITWKDFDSYMMGYHYRLSYGGINILYGGNDDMGVCVTMSGSGCRTFESYFSTDWVTLFTAILSGIDSGDFKITRLDVAFDDHSGLLDMAQVMCYVDEGNYVSKSRWWEIAYGSEGSTVYIGSPQSAIRIRIYDKAAERGYDDSVHWIRVEMQLRDDRALAFLREVDWGFCSVTSLGEKFRAVLGHYLRFVEPSQSDSNKRRWKTAAWWASLLDGVEAVSLWSAPGVNYNIFHVEDWLVNTVGSAIYVYDDIIGLDELIDKIRHRPTRMSAKYIEILRRYGKEADGRY